MLNMSSPAQSSLIDFPALGAPPGFSKFENPQPGPPPGFPAKPLSFAQAISKPASPQIDKNHAITTVQKQPGASSSIASPSSQQPQLKRIPKGNDANVLRSCLEMELNNKVHLVLFTEISQTDKTAKRLILMRGVPGSGKSTLATLLAGVTNSGVVYSADDFFMDRKGNYNFNPQDLPKAHEVCKKQSILAMAAGTTPIVIDNTNTQSWEMMPYVEMAIQYNYKVHVVEPTTAWKSNAGILCKKNKHGVEKKKIQSMLDRYEKGITPEILLQKARGNSAAATTDLESALENLSL